MPARQRSSRLLKVLAVLVLLLVAFVVFVATFDLNRLRPLIARKSKESLGRELMIAGNLRIHWSLKPTLSAEEVTFANASWASPEPMAKVGYFAVTADPLAYLFHRRLFFPKIEATDAVISLEKKSEDLGNWNLSLKPKPGEDAAQEQKSDTEKTSTTPFPTVGDLALTHVTIRYLDMVSGAEDKLVIDKSSGKEAEGGGGLAWMLDGRMSTRSTEDARAIVHPLRIRADLGDPQLLIDQATPWPISAEVRYADLNLKATGKIGDLALLKDVDLTVEVHATGLGPLLRERAIKAGDVPSLSAFFTTSGSAGHWRFEKVRLKLGRSEAEGFVDLTTGDRIAVKTELASKLIDIDDITTLTAPQSKAPPHPKEAKASPAKKDAKPSHQAQVFTTEPYDLGVLRAFDLDFKATVDRLTSASSKVDLFDDGSIDLKLKDGLLVVTPLSLSLANGRLKAELHFDAHASTPTVALKLGLTGLDLERLIDSVLADYTSGKSTKGEPVSAPVRREINRVGENTYGEIGGQADVTATGRSPHELAKSLTGTIGVALQDGHVSDVLAYAGALDVGKVVEHYLSGDKGSKVDCMILALKFDHGHGVPNPLLIAAKTMNIEGEGKVDLDQENMDLVLKTYPKHISLDSLRAPLEFRGPLSGPEVRLQTTNVIGRVIAAVALGTLATPAAAILPFIELGLGKKGLCYEHVSELATLQSKTKG